MLLTLLRRFYPALAPAATITTAPAVPDSSTSLTSYTSSTCSADGFGVLAITSDPEAAEIFVDGKFHGNAPATLKLAAGSYSIVLKSSGFPDYSRTIEVQNPASSR